MLTRSTILALVFAMALGVSASASAQKLDFNYLEANYVNVDLDFSGSFFGTDTGPFALETDSGAGFHLGGAWQVWRNIHLFGEYSKASQDLEIIQLTNDDPVFSKDDFDVIRYRLGLGYSQRLSRNMVAYGRISYDYIELDGRRQEFEPDTTDDEGFGFEAGLLWAPIRQVHVQPSLRYTAVGDIDRYYDGFESDILLSLAARFYINRNFALQGAYEYGDIKTWSVGGRYAF